MPERKSDRDLYWGPDLEERGVLMCSCVGVWGRERLLYVCVCGGGGGGGVTSDKE